MFITSAGFVLLALNRWMLTTFFLWVRSLSLSGQPAKQKVVAVRAFQQVEQF
jgi:hypothetical protein